MKNYLIAVGLSLGLYVLVFLIIYVLIYAVINIPILAVILISGLFITISTINIYNRFNGLD